MGVLALIRDSITQLARELRSSDVSLNSPVPVIVDQGSIGAVTVGDPANASSRVTITAAGQPTSYGAIDSYGENWRFFSSYRGATANVSAQYNFQSGVWVFNYEVKVAGPLCVGENATGAGAVDVDVGGGAGRVLFRSNGASTPNATIDSVNSANSAFQELDFTATKYVFNGGEIVANAGSVQIGSSSGGNRTLNFTGVLTSGSSINPTGSNGAATLAFATSGSYGGGIGLVDGSYNWGIWDTSGTLVFGSGTNSGALSGRVFITASGNFSTTGSVSPAFDNTYALGNPSDRWSVVYSAAGTINTSDAREKTAVKPLTPAEIDASKQIADEIGVYQWLSAIELKGKSARLHVGTTVQRVIEIMKSNGLDPMRYGFVCYDEWPETPAISAIPAVEAEFDKQGNPTNVPQDEIPEVPARPAGDRYGLRYDELNAFIARGLSYRISAIEDRINVLKNI